MLLALSTAIRALLTARPKYCAWKATPSLRLLSVSGNQYSSSRPNSHAAASFVHNVAWSYEAPPPAFAAIAGRIAFHAAHVDFQVDGHSPADGEDVDDQEDGPA